MQISSNGITILKREEGESLKAIQIAGGYNHWGWAYRKSGW